MQSLQDYVEMEMRLFQRIPYTQVDKLVTVLERARSEGRHVYLFGNGGSASTASHFACDLGKGTIQPGKPRFKVLALNDSLPTLTAFANDQGYENVFAEPLITWARPGDIAVAFSGSGNSPNVVQAMQVARRNGLMTVGFTGFEGGRLKQGVELEINVPSDSMAQIEDVHLALTHAVCEMLKIDHG